MIEKIRRLVWAVRRPTLIVVKPGDIIITNGRAYAIYPNHIKQLPKK